MGESWASTVVGGMLSSLWRWALQRGRRRGLAFQAKQKLWSEEAQTGEERARLEFKMCCGKMGHEAGRSTVPGSEKALSGGWDIVLSEGAREPQKVIGKMSTGARFGLQGSL